MTAYQLLVSRATLTIDGEETPQATVSVRNGVALARLPNGESHTMAVASVDKSSRKVATVTGTDGTVWTVAKRGCGCGGGR
jgi:hypothetical protein